MFHKLVLPNDINCLSISYEMLSFLIDFCLNKSVSTDHMYQVSKKSQI
jgi:hypothetical protein